MKSKTVYEKYEEDKDFERIMMQEDLIMAVTEDICQILEKKEMKRNALAKLMGKTKGYISQLLNSGRNITLRSLADFAFYLGYTVEISFKKKRVKQQNIIHVDWELGSNEEKKKSFVADDYQIVHSKISRIAS